MVNKLLIQCFLCCLLAHYANAQSDHPKYIVGVETQFLVGGQTNASYDFLLGASGIFLLKKKKQFTVFSSIGFATDIFNTDSRLISGDIQMGSFWSPAKKFSLFVGLGGHYIHESHSLLLIEGQHNWQNSIMSVTGNAGFNIRLFHSLDLQIFFKQTGLVYSSIGAGFNYSF